MTSTPKTTLAVRAGFPRYLLATGFAVLATLFAATSAHAAAAVPRDLYDAARAHPASSFSVIVQGDGTAGSASVASSVVDAITAEAQAALAQGQAELDAARANASAAEARLRQLKREIARAEQKATADRAHAAKFAAKNAKQYAKFVARAEAGEAKAALLRTQVPAAEERVVEARAAIPPLEAEVAELLAAYEAARSDASREQLGEQFMSISGVSARLLGADLVELARSPGILSISRDAPVALAPGQARVAGAVPDGTMWRQTTGLDLLWTTVDPVTGAISFAPEAPAIAIVDSGVDASRLEDFGGRVVASVNVSSLAPGRSGDDQGHGTMVAGVAAGSSPLYPGAAPNAPIVDVRTSDASGKSLTSDILRGIDWILRHRKEHGIRVANFSLAGTTESSIKYDPLDRAVESLWLNGIVVVAAVGNHGSESGPSPIPAPGNDPFIITVGAVDQLETANASDDVRAPWSAYGYTADGFAKPELSAPGRYIVAPVPMTSTLATARPDRVVAPGYMWMSGTSFAAPIVAGAAAQILARHPDWTPDQVKGALMLSAVPLAGEPFAAGVGEIAPAVATTLTAPPNANAALAPYVVAGAAGRAFDVAGWETAVRSNASWSSASWSSASWSSASWSSASWSSASWSSASWSSASWSSASWSSASWSSASDVE